MAQRKTTYRKGIVTKEKLLKAIENSGGIVSVIANKLGVSWHTANKYIQKWEETKQAYKDETQKFLDICEKTVLKSVKEGDVQTAKWVLAHKARDRGYGDKLELAGQLDTKITINIIGEDTEN